jgi:hypothetical protein
LCCNELTTGSQGVDKLIVVECKHDICDLNVEWLVCILLCVGSRNFDFVSDLLGECSFDRFLHAALEAHGWSNSVDLVF